MRFNLLLIVALATAFALVIAPSLIISAALMAAVVVFAFRWLARGRRSQGVWR